MHKTPPSSHEKDQNDLLERMLERVRTLGSPTSEWYKTE